MRFLILLLSCFTLTACVTQEQADVKMEKGCIAGINSLLKNENKTILEIKAKSFSEESIKDETHRKITIMAVEKDGWIELDKQYSCLFAQEWGFFKNSHLALLKQIDIDGDIYGEKDGVIIGSFNDFHDLTKAVSAAMR